MTPRPHEPLAGQTTVEEQIRAVELEAVGVLRQELGDRLQQLQDAERALGGLVGALELELWDPGPGIPPGVRDALRRLRHAITRHYGETTR